MPAQLDPAQERHDRPLADPVAREQLVQRVHRRRGGVIKRDQNVAFQQTRPRRRTVRFEAHQQYARDDRNYPLSYEPSGEDFFSAGLNVTDAMRRVLPPAEYSAWLDEFVPGLRAGDLGQWGRPAEVSDPTDGRIIHLAGPNLNRAWNLGGTLSVLPPADPRRVALAAALQAHEAAGLGFVFSGHYEGEHWLATFAVYHLSQAGL